MVGLRTALDSESAESLRRNAATTVTSLGPWWGYLIATFCSTPVLPTSLLCSFLYRTTKSSNGSRWTIEGARSSVRNRLEMDNTQRGDTRCRDGFHLALSSFLFLMGDSTNFCFINSVSYWDMTLSMREALARAETLIDQVSFVDAAHSIVAGLLIRFCSTMKIQMEASFRENVRQSHIFIHDFLS